MNLGGVGWLRYLRWGGSQAWHVALSADGPQLARAVSRGDKGAASQAELGQGLR